MKKVILSLLLSYATLLCGQETSSYKLIEDKSGLTIATPTLAKRHMRKLRLENGLEALLISDPETHKSGAALAIAVGSWDDPIDRPGMAHFVEHMLFLGTEKYPEEEGYTRYLDEHGGARNAFTMSDRTVYMFSVNNAGFHEALDRFGQFFIAPKFNPSGVDRECKAIHQEYCKDLPLDPWRVLYVKKELANKKHPFHTFCIGNQETLARISQDELKKWYGEHYSANLMHLVLYSPLDLDTLEKETVSLFSAVKNQERAVSQSQEPLLDPQDPPTLCVITPVQEVQFLELSWEIPRFYGQDRLLHADKLLSHVLGHEGSTSLLAQLKRENLADALSIGNFRAGNDQCLLSLTVQLTKKGVAQYEQVIERCFEAVAAMRRCGIPRYVFDEVCRIEEMRYRFQSRQEVFDLVEEYAMRMIDEPLETYPRQTLIPSDHSPEKIAELIRCLTPDKCRYTLIASPNVTQMKATVKEKWLGVGYTLKPLAMEKIKAWADLAAHPAITIPRPNPFIPENLDIKAALSNESSIVPHPQLLHHHTEGKIYLAEDSRFLVPEVCFVISFKTPVIADSDPLSHVFADLFCHTLTENLNTITYEAQTAGLTFSIKPKHGALELQIHGYNDKAAPFLETIITAMKTTCPSQEMFILYKELLAREYSNTLNATPLKQGGDVLWGLLFKEFAGLMQKREALNFATYDKMHAFCHQLLKKCYVEGMLYGNLSYPEGEAVWNIIKNHLKSEPYPPALHPSLELAHLPGHDSPALIMLKSEQPANALILTADCGPFTFKKRAAQEILTKGLEEPFFSELRTRQQTAYLVTNWSQELERHLYSFFAIQSSSHDTRDLLSRFELFIETSLQHLKEKVIPKERFEAIKTAYIHQLRHPVENLLKMGGFLHTLAFQYDGDFEWLEKRVAAFENLTYEEFLNYTHAFLGKENMRRLALCINGTLPKKESVSYHQLTTPEKLRKKLNYMSREKVLALP